MSVIQSEHLVVVDCPLEKVDQRILDNGSGVLYLNGCDQPDSKQVKQKLTNDQKAEIAISALNYVRSFGDLESSGVSIKEIMRIGKSSAYFFHRLRVTHELKLLQLKIAEIDLHANNYAKLLVYTTDTHLYRYWEKSTLVDVKLVPTQAQRRRYGSICAYGWRFFKRSLLGIFHYSRRRKYEFAIVDRPLDYVRTTDGYENPFIGRLLDNIGSDALIISELPLTGFKGSNYYKEDKRFNLHQGQKNKIYGESILAQGLLFKWRQTKKISSEIEMAMLRIQENDLPFEYHFILNRFIALHATTKLYVLKQLSYERFFSKGSIQSVVASDENSLAHRVILNAAREWNIRTVGIQHGAIGHTSANYMYSNTDFNYSPVPDITLVWGAYWKNILTSEGNYSESCVEIVGQLRADAVPLLRKQFEPSKDEKTIVFASQPIPDEEYRERALLDYLWLAEEFSEYHFYIRPHPRELDMQYFRSRFGRFEVKNVVLNQEEELYSLLAKSNVLITCYSTVAVEALLFGLDVILLDYYSEDILGLGKAGLATICTNKEQLREAIKGNVTLSEINLKKFISDHFYQLDGLAAERASRIIRS